MEQNRLTARKPLPFRLHVENVLLFLAKAFAIIGGLVLIAMSLVTVYSIIGRALPNNLPLLGWWRSIRGNFELVELATAVAIFSFLPWTHLTRGNVLVDFFTMRASPRAKAGFALFANLLFAAIAVLFAWRMVAGTRDMLGASYKQTTMLLRVPVLWGYLPGTIFMCFLALVTVYTVWRSAAELFGDGEPEDN